MGVLIDEELDWTVVELFDEAVSEDDVEVAFVEDDEDETEAGFALLSSSSSEGVVIQAPIKKIMITGAIKKSFFMKFPLLFCFRLVFCYA